MTNLLPTTVILCFIDVLLFFFRNVACAHLVMDDGWG